MSTPGPDYARISSSADEAAAANRAAGVGRAVHHMRGWFVEGPKYVRDGSGATAADTNEARDHRQAEVVDDGTAGLETAPAHVDSTGKVVNMDQYRMEKGARAQVDEAFETLPQPNPSIEDLLLEQAA